jgi:hypothetical protein
MAILLENENALTDSLHCCSPDVTRGNPMHQRYGRGIIMGMRSAFMALGWHLAVADTLIRNCLPADVDPACLPEGFSASYLKGRFQVNEHFNGYALTDTVTGQTHWLSDGVDCVAATEDGEYLSPGTPGFTEMWESDFNSNESETMDAYFPDQLKLEEEGKVVRCEYGTILDDGDAEFHANAAGKLEAYCPSCGHSETEASGKEERREDQDPADR